MVGAAPGRAVGRVHARALVAGALVAVALTSSGCSSPDDASPAPRAVTAEEAQLLAIARFKNFDAGARAVSVDFEDAGHALSLVGWFDYATGIGYGELADSGTPNSLLTWQGDTLAVHPAVGATAPLPPPGAADALDSSWRSGPMDPTSSTLHAVLEFVEELGSTRPENPLLLQQGGALWLRDDSLAGTPVTVFAGPTGLAGPSDSPTAPSGDGASRVHYWVDTTGLLLRVDVLLGAAWVTIDLGPGGGVTLGWSVPGTTA